MGDCFHAHLPTTFLQRIFATIREVDRHQYLLLTKRPDRAARLWPVLTDGDTFSQVRFGITAENQHWLEKRLAPFLAVPTPTKFISVEPMLGPVVLPKVLLDMGPRLQIVIGGESGADARPMAERWVTDLVVQCLNADVAIFFKQWGEWAPARLVPAPLPKRTCNPAGTDETVYRFGKKAAGRLLWGIQWNGEPTVRHQNDKQISRETTTTTASLPKGWKPGDIPPWRSSSSSPPRPRRGMIKCHASRWLRQDYRVCHADRPFATPIVGLPPGPMASRGLSGLPPGPMASRGLSGALEFCRRCNGSIKRIGRATDTGSGLPPVPMVSMGFSRLPPGPMASMASSGLPLDPPGSPSDPPPRPSRQRDPRRDAPPPDGELTPMVAGELIDDVVWEFKREPRTQRMERWVECPSCKAGGETGHIVVTRHRPGGTPVVRAACSACSWYAMR